MRAREYSVDIEARVVRWNGDPYDRLDEFMGALVDLDVLGPIVHGDIPKLIGARFHVVADTPGEAIPKALRSFRRALSRIGVETGVIERVEALVDERLG